MSKHEGGAVRSVGVVSVSLDLGARELDPPEYHLSFDLDGIDPMEAPGVGTPVPDIRN